MPRATPIRASISVARTRPVPRRPRAAGRSAALLGVAAAPGSAADRPAADDRARTPAGAARAAGRTAVDSDDEDEWRHEPVAPVDERNPLKSLGRAVADVATGGAEDTSQDTSKPRGR